MEKITLTDLQKRSITIDSDNNYFKTDENNNLYSKDGTQLYWVKNDLTKIDIPDTVFNKK